MQRHYTRPSFSPYPLSILSGVGAGTKDFPGHANVVRVVIGTYQDNDSANTSNSAADAVAADALLQRGGTGTQNHNRRPVGYLGEDPDHHHHHPYEIAAKQESRPLVDPSSVSSSIQLPPSNDKTTGGGSAWSSGGWEERHLCELEANLDDMTPETASFALERLLAEPGCLDVWYTPAVMKKGRPGLTMHLLCEPSVAPNLLRRMFLETPTLGVRAHTVARLALERDFVVVPTRYGEVRAKVCMDYTTIRKAEKIANIVGISKCPLYP